MLLFLSLKLLSTSPIIIFRSSYSQLFLLWLVGAAAFHITSSGSLSVRKSRGETHSLILYLLFSIFPLGGHLYSLFFFLFHSYTNSDKKEKPAQCHNFAPRFLPFPSIFITNFFTFPPLKQKHTLF